MMSTDNVHYLISCQIPTSEIIDDTLFFGQQDAVINRMLLEGRLLSYAFSQETSQWWAICCAETDYELQMVLTEMPFHYPEATQIAPLATYASNDLGGFSLN